MCVDMIVRGKVGMATVVCRAERAQWSHFWPPVMPPTCQIFGENKTKEGIVCLMNEIF